MHENLIKIDKEKVQKPQNPKPVIVYFSSISNNTARFVEKLNFKNFRIPVNLAEKILVEEDYVLICPTYSGGGNLTSGAVPKQVIQFLNNQKNRSFCRAIIASGNSNFGNTFALAGPILSAKLKVPLLYQFELLGTQKDVDNLSKILFDFWKS